MLLLQMKHRSHCRKRGWGRAQNRVDKDPILSLFLWGLSGEGKTWRCDVWARTAGLTLGGVSSLSFHSWNIHLRNLLCLPEPPFLQSEMGVRNAYSLPKCWAVDFSVPWAVRGSSILWALPLFSRQPSTGEVVQCMFFFNNHTHVHTFCQ